VPPDCLQTVGQPAADQIRKADVSNWKKIKVEFGKDFLDIAVPPSCVTLNMKRMPCLTSSKDEIASALNHPIGSPTLPLSTSKTAVTLKPWAAKTVELAIAPGATPGLRVVRITTPAGQSTAVGTGGTLFTVQ